MIDVHYTSLTSQGVQHWEILGSLSMCDFRTRTASGSELFSLLTCLQATTFTLLSTFSPSGMVSMKIWETALSWHGKCSPSVAVRVSKRCVLKLPNIIQTVTYPDINLVQQGSTSVSGRKLKFPFDDSRAELRLKG